ncbi:P-loop containing nucleoside triphosphate hydrolase protein [Colletotrichum eremochloae]|nr:P-loop containing nucleoside triphosphate hydrolase protein [Colletotrichum eremochloae]
MSSNALWILYLLIGRFFLVYVHSTCFGVVRIRITNAFRVGFILAMVSQDISFIDSCAPGTVASTISDSAGIVGNGSIDKIGNLIQNMSMLVAAFVMAFTGEWKLTLVTAITLPVFFIWFKITFGLDAKIKTKIQDIYKIASSLVEEALGSTRAIAAFNFSAKLSGKYDDYLVRVQKLGFRKGPIVVVQWNIDFLTIYCTYAPAWLYGVKLLNNGDIGSGGQIISVLLAVSPGTNATSKVAPGFDDFAQASVAAKGMFEMSDHRSEINPLAGAGERPADCKGLIDLRDVLCGINFTSGSGKSTIVGLIERWFNPTTGSIRLEGHDIADLDTRWLLRQIGLVQQEPVPFSDTIYSNVVHGLYGTAMNSMPESEKRGLVSQDSIKTFADQFIEKLPQKYNTKVGECSALLSGAQKQRIAIARSIIVNPQILLSDEAPSALDPAAQSQVKASLDNISKQPATIMIAYKLSAVHEADKIIIISKGKVVNQRTLYELLAVGAAYHQLVKAQTLHTSPAKALAQVDITADYPGCDVP